MPRSPDAKNRSRAKLIKDFIRLTEGQDSQACNEINDLGSDPQNLRSTADGKKLLSSDGKKTSGDTDLFQPKMNRGYQADGEIQK